MGIFPGGEMSKFLTRGDGGGGNSHHPLSRENPVKVGRVGPSTPKSSFTLNIVIFEKGICQQSAPFLQAIFCV